jgi:hypothetical protein
MDYLEVVADVIKKASEKGHLKLVQQINTAKLMGAQEGKYSQ